MPLTGNRTIEDAAIRWVVRLAEAAGRIPVDYRADPAYPADISSPPRVIEVKAFGKTNRGEDLWLEATQEEAARSNPDFYLYVVEYVAQGDPAAFTLKVLQDERLASLLARAKSGAISRFPGRWRSTTRHRDVRRCSPAIGERKTVSVAEDVVLAGVDEEHLRSAAEQIEAGWPLVSFGTDFWVEDARERPESWPEKIPIYFYAVTRGLSESVPLATWAGRFVGYETREAFRAKALDRTRPPTAVARRDPNRPSAEQEPDWNGFLLVSDLRALENSEWVPLGRFLVGGRPFRGTVVRHPMLCELPL